MRPVPRVHNAVAVCCGHPAVLMYAVAKELPPQIVRWHGKKKVEAFLTELFEVAKDRDPEPLSLTRIFRRRNI